MATPAWGQEGFIEEEVSKAGMTEPQEPQEPAVRQPWICTEA